MRLSALVCFALLITASACSSDTEDPATGVSPADSTSSPAITEPGDTVLGLIGSTPSLAAFAAQLEAAGLSELLRDTSQTFTVFAPSAEALSAAGPLDTEQLRGLVINTRLFSGDLEDGLGIETLNGSELTFSTSESGVTIGATGGATARVLSPDLDAGNGVVHIIDGVLTR